MITIDNITKRFGTKTVVEAATFTIPKGKLTSFIGPNGAGKSTVLSMISRLAKADAGVVTLEGTAISQFPSDDLAKRLSILKQSNHLGLRVTVRELVGFGRFPYSKGRLTALDHEKIDRAIAYVGLEEMQDKQINALSGGQKQRAFIAMVIAQDTDYILLDEPLNNLDMRHAVQVMKLLRKLVDEEDKTIVVVLHDLNFASVYSDQMVAMKEGQIVATGPTEQLMEQSLLENLYEMDLTLEQMDDHKICLYYT
ncbi:MULTISPECIES: ATP-binding cassette domain-containing protein [unclassified Exiguobacterium]|uniref:iron ABC transporter ATP-binding protein n=1 Tax=unclassified Exiguobacterium TaxID=2644629 RepID=UPI000B587678|nr:MULTISPECIES: ATP-binding cassette domain-containing protein [unclassified Exiguobacterium]ASI36471.1 iron ABC transporter ATP-binding protein [Exiguobacterium sp. N4-1P]